MIRKLCINMIILMACLFGQIILSTFSSNNVLAETSSPIASCQSSSSFGVGPSLTQDLLYLYIQQNLTLDTSASCSSANTTFKICSKTTPQVCQSTNLSSSVNLGGFTSDALLTNPMFASLKLYTLQQESSVCVFFDTPDGAVYLTCKNVTTAPPVQPEEDKCNNISAACSGSSKNSKSKVSFGGQTIECLRSTLDASFFGNSLCTKAPTSIDMQLLSPFFVFQKALRTSVMAALTLYVIFFGFNMVLKPNETATTNEVFLFVLKVILVVYFAVGSIPQYFNFGTAVNGGMTDIVLPLLLSAFNDFSNMIYQAAGSGGPNGLCYFDASTYNTGYGYYAMWDSLDCRIAYYLGEASTNGLAAKASYCSNGNSSCPKSELQNGAAYLVVLSYWIGGAGILMFIYGLVFVILLLSITLNIISSFVLYLVTLYVLTYVSPIFIPMVLFKYTKKYFDAWSNLLLATALQPFVVVAFLALMITLFDTTLYGTCTFTASNGSYAINLSTDPLCTNTFGYKVFQAYLGNGWKTRNAYLFSYSYLDADVQFISDTASTSLFFLVFFFLMQSTNKMAASLTGGIDVSSMAIGATALASQVGKLAAQTASGVGKIAKFAVKGSK